MENYTDEELVEVIKKWWQENGKSIIAGLAIGLVVIFGWRYWTAHQKNKAEQASFHYEMVLQGLAQGNVAQAKEQSQILLAGYSGSSYATLAALQLAKLAVTAGDLAGAKDHLERVLDDTDEAAIRDIASLRLARVLFEQGQVEAAEARMQEIQDVAFSAELEELKGDIYLSRNELEKARAAYEAASRAGGSSFLQLKLANLPPRTLEN
ncbi:MAG: tetratricopeptide repeat protein [Candidatus Competibacteraceae bacterium]|nr:tetratricopeptide repeat protein [Candidatus Competibacteraceae bacterium]